MQADVILKEPSLIGAPPLMEDTRGGARGGYRPPLVRPCLEL